MIVLETNTTHASITITAEKLDSSISQNLKSEIVTAQKQGVEHLIIDLSQVRYCDSSGLGALLLANRTFNEDGKTFAIRGIQPNVFKLIQISQLDSILNFIN
jgi:anti-sigma B factor antagonist